MVVLEPDIPDNGRYSIKETSRHLGIHRNSLKTYTDQGLIKCGFRKASMKKFYAGSEIKRFWKSTY
jgi:DNA-binding transcriptional MerR regulator